MRTVDHKALARMVRESSFMLGNFPGKVEDPNVHGWQLTCGKRVKVAVGRGESFERTEWHCVTFGALPAAPPETYMHVSYGTCASVKLLLLDEIERARKLGDAPRMHAAPACWGSAGARPAHFTVDAGDDVAHPIHGKVHVVKFGHSDCYLHVADFDFKPAGEFAAAKWSRTADDLKDPKWAHYAYQFGAAPAEVAAQ